MIEESIVNFTYHGQKSFSAVSGRAGIQYRFSPGAMLYATYNRGYRSGGYFGGFATSVTQLDPYNNETVNAYEAGAKLAFLNRKVRLNLSGFYYDYQNMQVFTLQQRGGITVQVLNNAANARIYGGEAELTVAPARGIEITNSISLLSAKYLDFMSAGVDLSNNTLPGAPKFTYSAGLHFNRNISETLGVEASVNASYRSSSYFETQNLARLKQDGYWLVDGRVGLVTGGKVGVGFWVRNLFDKRYATNVSSLESFGVDVFTIAKPRTLGGYLRFTY